CGVSVSNVVNIGVVVVTVSTVVVIFEEEDVWCWVKFKPQTQNQFRPIIFQANPILCSPLILQQHFLFQIL
ncbi:MAG: hypothetical protein P8Y18_11200, partial [Candidatus Bathyarchaeota archaeon]